MTDSINQPAPAGKKAIPRWVWWLCGILAALLIASICIPVYGEAAPKSIRTRNLATARGIFPALKMYAGDNDGQYPRLLAELVPYYLNPPHVPWYHDDSDKQHYRFEWFYVPGLHETSPPNWILFASPTDDLAGKRVSRARIVVYNDGSAKIIPAEEFHTALTVQLKAMATRTSEQR